MPGVNDRAAAAVRAFRERAGMPQAELAARVNEEAGLTEGRLWRQSTVARVEAGTQPLRLDEADAVARIFGVPVARLTWATGEAAAVMAGEHAISVLRQAFGEAAEGIARLHAARAGARRAARDLAGSRHERARALAGEIESEVSAASVRAAAAEGKARFEKEAGQ